MDSFPTISKTTGKCSICLSTKVLEDGHGVGGEKARNRGMISPFANIATEERCSLSSPTIRKVRDSLQLASPGTVLDRMVCWRMDIDVKGHRTAVLFSQLHVSNINSTSQEFHLLVDRHKRGKIVVVFLNE